MGSDPIARRVVIHGRVQGVFFRDTMRSVARDAGVSGWAANRDDGTVEAVVEGPSDGVDRVLEFCRRGPEQAEVERVDVDETGVEGLTGFEIR
ncbi:MAG TPA: acylphosphatase [Solirubrobacteraceae bacterium]|jgi:acylphosphatase|nr:acylphosphatase [Solirubrobacteraceae bacterium]